MNENCPTLQYLDVNVTSVDNTCPQDEANRWLSVFETSIFKEDLDSLSSLFHERGFWKDILALTWTIRTIRGHASIRHMLDSRLRCTGLSALCLLKDTVRGPTIITPCTDMIFIRFCFEFETIHGKGMAVAFLVPTPDGTWIAWSLLTRLHALKAYPEKIGGFYAPSAPETRHENWEDRRRREIDFVDGDPTVLVVGAGHCGLDVAARLTCLDVPTLVIEKHKRVGDNWRTRYKSLHLNNTKWFNRRPYLDFPPTWPVYCPGAKFGDWLEHYATALDLNVWSSSSIMSATFSEDTKTWQVTVNRGGRPRTMTVKHLVIATGLGGGHPKVPDVPGKELYRGSVLHSSEFASADDYKGKKAIIIGVGASGHDIAHDFCRRGWEVTMIQRSPICVVSQETIDLSIGERYNDHFPVEFADILGIAMPYVTQKSLLKISTARIANGMDKELLDNLAKVGFQTYFGNDGAGPLAALVETGGGAYIDSGVSQKIIDGAIKVKCSPCLRKFTEGGVELEDKTVLEGDVVVFATGFGDFCDSVVEICGSDVAKKVGNLWGLDVEGEPGQGLWKRTGQQGLWIVGGKPISKHVTIYSHYDTRRIG